MGPSSRGGPDARGGLRGRVGRVGDWLRRIALSWAAVMVVLLAVLAVTVGVPEVSWAGSWWALVQSVLLGVYALGTVVAWRWPVPGATVLMVCAFVMGMLSSLEYPTWQGLLVAAGLAVPAFLLWLRWVPVQSWRPVVGVAVVLALLVTGSGVGAARIWDYFHGPVAVQSATPTPSTKVVRWMWSGAVTPTSGTVVARLRHAGSSARLLYGTSSTLRGPVMRTGAARTSLQAARFDLTGLRPGTTYYYAVEHDGLLGRERIGRLRTPELGAQSFTVAFGACARLGSNASTFDAIRAVDPDLMLLTGDAFYADIADDDTGEYARAYDAALSPPAPAALYGRTPTAYIWDDHDFGPNDAARTSPSRDAALAAYRAFVPHYPLAMPGRTTPVAQAFTIGRVRFVITDLRSQRDPATEPDGPGKSMMGARQRAWFERELLAAKDRYPLVVWVSSVPWIGRAAADNDTWAGYATERRSIADFIADNDISGLVMLAGDAHMVAADDGTNADYSTRGGGGFPVFHGAAIDQRGSHKGGPYSEGAFPGPGQFGLLRVEDDGGPEVGVTFEGRHADGRVLIRYHFDVGRRR